MEKSKGEHRQLLEWKVCEDEGSWESARHEVTADASKISDLQTPLYSIWHRYRLYGMFALLILVVSVGWWSWQRSQAGLAAVESELEAEIVAELWHAREPYQSPKAAESAILNTANVPGDPGAIVTQMEIRNIGGDWVVVEVTMQLTANGPSYRQTRLYHESERGWVRGEPVAAHWGAERRLESKHFVFHYRSLDEAAVMRVAPQLDGLYPEIYTFFNREVAAPEKLTITVDPEQSPGRFYRPNDPQVGLVVASPVAIFAPSETTTSDLLLQSLVIALYNRFVIEAFANGGYSYNSFRLYNALRLWLLWEHDLPLATWRKPLVQWILKAFEAEMRPPDDVPDFAQKLCAYHSLWLESPLDLSVPIFCGQSQAGKEKITAWPLYSAVVNLSFDSLIYSPTFDSDYSGGWRNPPLAEPGPYSLLLATVFEYVTATYGRDKLPLLLAAIPQHERAETLIPALFGIPENEFEAEWRTYLAERYKLEDVP